MSTLRTTTRVAAVSAGFGLGLLAAGPAFAHVTINPSSGHAGEYTVLTVSVPHGCDGSATTKVAIQVPEPILAVTPTRNPLWDVTKKIVTLAAPVKDAHGTKVTERVAQFINTAKAPLPDGYRDAFELSLQVPDVPGETLVFPTIQTCEKGSTAWTEVAAPGQSEDDLEHRAPTLEVLPADNAETATNNTAEAAVDTSTSALSGADVGDNNALGWAGILLGGLGLGAGGTALARSRRAA